LPSNLLLSLSFS